MSPIVGFPGVHHLSLVILFSPHLGDCSMLNYIWLALVIVAIVLGGINGKIEDVTKAAIDSAGNAVTIAIGLIGVCLSLVLGILNSSEKEEKMRRDLKEVKSLLGQKARSVRLPGR
jgi:hypothetical protein